MPQIEGLEQKTIEHLCTRLQTVFYFIQKILPSFANEEHRESVPHKVKQGNNWIFLKNIFGKS